MSDCVKRTRYVAMSVALLCGLSASAARADGPYQATGFKVGEVTGTTAIVWTRLTRNEKRNPSNGPMPAISYAGGKGGEVTGLKYPKGMTVADIRDAVPGAAGQVRVLYKPLGGQEWRRTSWEPVDAGRDFTRQFSIAGLRPGTRYAIRVETRGAGGSPGRSLDGHFLAAPGPDAAARVMFTVSTGQGYGSRDRKDGYEIYRSMLALEPSFFVHTGDIVYYDKLAKTIGLARYHWQRTYSLPTNVEFQRQVSSYFIKDDHDTWQDDCWPTMKRRNMYEFTFEQGLAVFGEQVPMGRQTYRTCRWGRDLQIWMVEGRNFRSPNDAPDGPDKTIWGETQKAWFKKTVSASDATFRILISPTPLVGPDRPKKNDNHANKGFSHEGRELRRFIASQKNMAVVCGDRHWQYMSVHPHSGVREYSCGPVSDKHAGGWKQKAFVKSYHRFLRVKGGFLSVTVERREGVPVAIFRHHDTKGRVCFEDRLKGGT